MTEQQMEAQLTPVKNLNGKDVIYRPRGCDFNVAATVWDTHDDDGTVTVLAHYVLDDDGEAEGDYIGATYRTKMSQLH